MSPIELVEAVGQYGALSLGRDLIRVAADVPAELQDELAKNFYNVRAIIQEWDAPSSGAAVYAAESLLANLPKSRRKRTTRKKAATKTRA